jgi:site-specific recombinase XerD
MIALVSGMFERPVSPCDRSSVPTLGKVIEEMLAAKRTANRRPYYIRALRQNLQRFARGRENLPIAAVTRDMIEDWLRTTNKHYRPSSLKTARRMISVLFGYAVRRGYMEKNPISSMEPVSVDRNPPRVLKPVEVRRMLRFTRRKMNWRLPHIVLGLYAGIRPMELTRLHWSDINLDRGYVTVGAAASKIRRRRVVHLDPKAIAWLKACRSTEHRRNKPIGSMSKRWKRLLLRHCGIVWGPDLLRHSAASYLLAKHGDVGKVARMLGNSADVLLNHYIDLIDPADCRRFWFWKPRVLTGASKN